MITFALYAKTFTDIPFIFPSLIIALFIFISIEKRWYKTKAFKALSYNKFLITGSCFVALTAYTAGLFPPVIITPYREEFDEFISGQSIRLMNAVDFNIDSTESGGINRDVDNEILLFRVKTDESGFNPIYLRRIVFDNWTGENWEHSSDDSARWQPQAFNKFNNRNVAVAVNTMEITMIADLETFFLPMPINPARINYSGADLFMSVRDEYFTDWTNRRGHTYTIEYHSSITHSELFRHRSYVDSCLEVGYYPNRSEVQELTAELISGIADEYSKAKALEQYFYNGEFTYDFDFEPESKAADYFLFETKRGTCSDFATAMTLMAREAGLPARYVEGYALQERDGETGEFLVRVKHGHAWTEVYINDLGWVLFEPTIPAVPKETTDSNLYPVILAALITTGIIIAAVILFMIFVLPRLQERRFVKRALRSSREIQVKMFYGKVYSMFMKRLRLSSRTLSSHDLNRLSLSEHGISLHMLTENFDRIVYGDSYAGDGDYYGIYTRFVKAEKMRKSKKK